jgi:PAS domain S-box-containing protein
VSQLQGSGAEDRDVALRESELRTRAVFETVFDGIITIDHAGTIQSFNRGAQRIFGYEAAEIVGQNVRLLMPEPYHSGHDGYLERYLRTGEARIIGIGREVMGKRKNGDIFPMYLAVADTKVGGLQLFTGIVWDISTLRRAERERQDAEARMRAVFETAADAIIVIDDHGSIEQANPAALRTFGYSLKEVLGANVKLLMPNPYHEEHDGYLANYRETGTRKLIGIGREVVGKRKDGSTFPMDLAVSDTELNDRRLFTGIIRDISERKRADDALREAQKLESLGVLAGGIAHDFNNLLVGILGNAGLALDELAPESPARELVREIELTGKRAAELAHQMLAYSGRGRFLVEPLDLNKLIQEMSHLLRVSVQKGAILRYNFSPGLPAIEADPTQIRQIVMNLVINASDAIGDSTGIVTISTGLMHASADYLYESHVATNLKEADYVFLEVSDTGAGMAADVKAKIFDPFFTTRFTGRGLGLAVVLGVIRGHGGSIKVYSEPGHGSTFKVLLPALAGASPAAIASAEEEGRWRASGLVLMVDDDETVRAVTRRALQAAGLTVLSAHDGRQGVEVFRQHQDDIALVLMDLTMPQMGGAEAFREIRAIKPGAKVILMSGYNEQETTEGFLGRGLAGFLQKPYELARLREVVREALAAPAPDRL